MLCRNILHLSLECSKLQHQGKKPHSSRDSNMVSENQQVLYSPPHGVPWLADSIGFWITLYVCLNIIAPHAPFHIDLQETYLSIFLNSLCIGCLINIALLCVLSIMFDPNTAHTTEKQVGGNGEDGSGSGISRVIKAKRLFFAFKRLKLCVDISEEMGDVWYDGVWYEGAFFEI